MEVGPFDQINDKCPDQFVRAQHAATMEKRGEITFSALKTYLIKH